MTVQSEPSKMSYLAPFAGFELDSPEKRLHLQLEQLQVEPKNDLQGKLADMAEHIKHIKNVSISFLLLTARNICKAAKLGKLIRPNKPVGSRE